MIFLNLVYFVIWILKLFYFFKCIYVNLLLIDVDCLFNTLSGIKIYIEKRDVLFFMKKRFMLNLIILQMQVV